MGYDIKNDATAQGGQETETKVNAETTAGTTVTQTLESVTEKTSQNVDSVSTMGGNMRLRWDNKVEMSSNAHHVLFSSFLKQNGLFDHLVETAPLEYTSNNRPDKRNVIGTAVLGILDGAKRFRHFDSLTGDGVSAEVFGLSKLMSCDSVRRGMLKIDAKKGLLWIWEENLRCLAPVLPEDYILDMDPTVKTVYGEQEGAEVGYNPHKPGHAGLCYHVMSIATLRMPLGIVVLPGNETAGKDSLPMMETFLSGVPDPLRPWLVRGDVSFGKDNIIKTCEGFNQHYLFKLGRTKRLKDEWNRVMGSPESWQSVGDGWQTYDFKFRLSGWDRDRRMVMVRRLDPKQKCDIVQEARPEGNAVAILPGFESIGNRKLPDGYEWYTLVTDLEIPASDIASLYRQRGDCENIYDEMKNQWGWSGFNSHKLGCTTILAALVALVSNWWNVFCRLGEDGSHREATTARPLLQRCVASITSHAREKTVTLYVASKEATSKVFHEIGLVLSKIATATQLAPEVRHMVLVRYAFRLYSFKERTFPPIIGNQYTLGL